MAGRLAGYWQKPNPARTSSLAGPFLEVPASGRPGRIVAGPLTIGAACRWSARSLDTHPALILAIGVARARNRRFEFRRDRPRHLELRLGRTNADRPDF